MLKKCPKNGFYRILGILDTIGVVDYLKLIIHIIIILLLMLCTGGIGWSVATYGLESNLEKAAILVIAFMSLTYPIYASIDNYYDKIRLKKTKIISGSTLLDLKKNLNEELIGMKKRKKIIVSVQITNELSALIVYMD